MGAIQKVNYEVGGEKIEITSATVKQYLVNGQGNVTDQEVMMFMKLCQGQHLNPFAREVYLVKYGNSPANQIIAKDAFTRRAEQNENYNGSKSGVIVANKQGEIKEREGSFVYKENETLIGGWAKVYFKDGKIERYQSVSLSEYNTGKSLWASKPATMIQKVALVQALREAFPSALNQLYIAEEIGVDEELPLNEVDPIEEQRQKEHVEAPQKPADAITKKQVMQLAKEKGLMHGEGKETDIEGLNSFCRDNGMNLRALTQDQAESLIKILIDYKVIVEDKTEKEPIEGNSEQSASDEVERVEAEVVESQNDEEEPF